MTDQPYSWGSGGPGSSPEPPPAVNEMHDIDARIEQIVAQRLDAAEKKHQAQITSMQAQLKAAQRPGVQDTYVPQHAGGPGTEIAETWCQAWQEMSSRGQEIPPLVLAHARGEVPPDTGAE